MLALETIMLMTWIGHLNIFIANVNIHLLQREEENDAKEASPAKPVKTPKESVSQRSIVLQSSQVRRPDRQLLVQAPCLSIERQNRMEPTHD
jgi:hypothetical protein